MATLDKQNSDSVSVAEEIIDILHQKPASLVHVDCKLPGSEDWVPHTKRSVGYIVGAVVLNKKGEVLLISEAKPSCRGRWYLPMGRLEPGETLVEGTYREVKEEAGVDLEVTSLACVECYDNWYRFVFTGTVTGKLKTLDEQDEESLEAGYFSRNLSDVNIRARDIIPLIELTAALDPSAPAVLPLERPHQKICFRWILLTIHNGTQYVLVSHLGGEAHLPVVQAAPHYECSMMLDKLLEMALRDPPTVAMELHALAAVEFCGKPTHEHDGALFTLVEQLSLCETPLPVTCDGFSWEALKDDSAWCRELLKRIKRKHLIPMRRF